MSLGVWLWGLVVAVKSVVFCSRRKFWIRLTMRAMARSKMMPILEMLNFCSQLGRQLFGVDVWGFDVFGVKVLS